MGTRHLKEPKKSQKFVGVFFDVDIAEQFRQIAERNHRTTSGELRLLVYEHLKCYAAPMRRTRPAGGDGDED